MADLPDRVRRRLDAVFGDLLADVTGDEQAGDVHPPDAADRRDEELLAERPPHHDRA
ncbi:MAG TPA: hypothetical protein VM367_07755 [Pseudonocardia sp.]|nr:hypothetical protein [Pseudonocardia sp.]